MSCPENNNCIPCQSVAPCVSTECPSISYTDTKCDVSYPFKCSYWTGSPISCLNIQTGDTGDVVISKLMAAICNGTINAPNNKFSINSTDTTIGFFSDKITPTFPITFTNTPTSGASATSLAIGLKLSTTVNNQLTLLTTGNTGLYIAPPTYKLLVDSTDTVPNYLYQKIQAGTNITIVKSTTSDKLTINATGAGTTFTPANTSTISLNLSTASTPVLTANLILNSLVLPIPTINSIFTYTTNSGGVYSGNTGGGNNVILEVGGKVSFNSTFTYSLTSDNEAVTGISGDWGTFNTGQTGFVIPGTTSNTLVGSNISSNSPTTITKTVTFTAPSSGLNVVGGKVVLATGNDSSSSSLNISFSYKYFCGLSSNSSLSSLSDFLGLSVSGWVSGGSPVNINSLITTSTQYLYFCIPTATPLNSIIQDGATGILSAFTPTVVSNFITASDITVSYTVYRSGINAFSNAHNIQFNF